MNNKDYQEALTNLKTYIVDYDDEFGEDIYLYESYKEEFDLLQELVDKHEQLEQENFELRQQLNTEEECCAMLENRVKKLNNLIKILEENFFIDIIERENDYKVGFEPKIPIVENIGYDKIGLKTRFAQINNDETKLLKEFLLDGRYILVEEVFEEDE